MARWWSGKSSERFWLEATDRTDVGTDLRAPLADSAGDPNWRYNLFQEAAPGDIVFHYDGNANAITGYSTIDGPAFERPIVWAARGSYARERGAEPVEVPGYAVPLRNHKMLAEPLTLGVLRQRKTDLEAIMESLRRDYGRQALYFPFELSSRPVRPLQGYAFKLPERFVRLFDLLPGAPQLRISNKRRVVEKGFERWRIAMLEGARRSGNLWVHDSDRFVLRNQDDNRSGKLGARTALGIDPTGKSWAVQINQAATPGDPNVATAIAIDGNGRSYLIHQGRLTVAGGPPILYEEFRRLTGLTPVEVENGDTNIPREWYVVTALEVSTDQIRANTAQFVDACIIARHRGEGVGSVADLAILSELTSPDETGGTYVVGGRSARDPEVVRKWQGEVWTAMAALLRENGFSVDKPRPAGRYEVDAEAVRARRKLLIEIKSGAAANDIYAGLGQLMLYAKILPRLARHKRVLLVPALPHPVLVEAVEAYGVTICQFECTETAGTIFTAFSSSFFKLCGLDSSPSLTGGPKAQR